MTIEKVILPVERLFYVAFNEADNPLYVRTLDPLQQGTREQYLKSIETSFLREDVTRVEVCSVHRRGQIYWVESFESDHKDFHFAHCEYSDCDRRVFTQGRYAKCAECGRLKCSEHGKFELTLNQSFCLDCYQNYRKQ